MLATRIFKLLTGTAFIVVGVAAASNGKFFSSASEVFVNGKLLSIRATGDGVVGINSLPFGTPVSDGDVLAEINPAAASPGDPPRYAEGDLSAMEAQIASLEALAAEKARQAELYQTGRIKHLEGKIAETQSGVLMLIEKEKQARALRERHEDLYSRNYIARTALVNSQSAEVSARIEREMLEKRIETQKLELAAAKRGTYIGDGYNDTSYSKQRADEIAVRLSELRADLLRKRLGNQQASLAGTVIRDAALSSVPPSGHPVSAPTDGKVWKVLVNRGDVVRAGEEILQVVDCGTLFVTVDASDRSLDGIATGQRAVFSDGADTRIDGTVIFTAGAERGVETVIRGALTQRRPELARTSIVVALKPDAADRARCPIGLKGQVTFPDDAGQLSTVPALLRRFGVQSSTVSGLIDWLGAQVSAVSDLLHRLGPSGPAAA